MMIYTGRNTFFALGLALAVKAMRGVLMTYPLTAGDAHMAGYGWRFGTAIDNEVVAFWLAANGFINRCIKGSVVAIGTKRFAQVCIVILPKAHIQHAGAGHTNAIARFAEIMRKWRNKANALARFSNGCIASRAAGAIVGIFQRVVL